MSLEDKIYDIKDLDSVSVTALRIISILNMLLIEPLSENEINEKLIENIIGSRYLSKDTICIYINTLRVISCEISRPTKKNGYKYVLKDHPFKLNFSQEEINSIIEARKYISTLGNWKMAIEIDDLFSKLYQYMSNESKKYFVSSKKTDLCREIDINNIDQYVGLLEKCCKENKNISVIYDSPNSGNKEIILKAEKLSLENGSLYLWGYNYEINEMAYLRLDRIKSITATNFKGLGKSTKALEAKYKLDKKTMFAFVPSENDTILEENDKEFIILTKITNKFKFFQEILSYGSSCTIISPENIKKDVLCKLNKMAELYQDVYLK